MQLIIKFIIIRSVFVVKEYILNLNHKTREYYQQKNIMINLNSKKIKLKSSSVAVIYSAISIAFLIISGCSSNQATKNQSNQSTPQPKSSVTPKPKEQKAIAETFKVTTPGKQLPNQPSNVKLPGTRIAELAAKHIPEDQKVKYNSNPPTSGDHYAVEAEWGIYNVAPVDERLVHNLEHGGIVISYNPDKINGEELEKLRVQVRKLSTTNPRIILTPRENLESAIALTAWGYLQKLDNYDPTAVKTFYDAHIARGPECQQGLCPG